MPNTKANIKMSLALSPMTCFCEFHQESLSPDGMPILLHPIYIT